MRCTFFSQGATLYVFDVTVWESDIIALLPVEVSSEWC